MLSVYICSLLMKTQESITFVSFSQGFIEDMKFGEGSENFFKWLIL